MDHRTYESERPCLCPAKPFLGERAVLDADEARGLRALFQVLASDTRLRILHALVVTPEMSPSEIATVLDMKSQAVSNQLQRLVDKGILDSRRNGNQVHYRIVDPCVPQLLDYGLCLAEDAEGRRR
ncbi:MAG: metalloregulator ArsR/SmtB family transcription factor [Thermodesulfobacteriota bacterium]